MATVTLASEPTYGVKIHGQLFPHHLRRSLSRTATSPHEVSVEAHSAQERLIESIWRRLPFADTECVGKEELLEGYAASLQLLQQFHGELDELLKALCRASVRKQHVGKLEAEEMAVEVDRIVDVMYRHGNLRPLPIDNAVNAQLLSKPTEVVQQQLTSSLRRIATSLATQTFCLLDRLTDRNVTGVIQWTDPSTCSFHFFTESLTQTSDDPTVSERNVWNGAATEIHTIQHRSGEHIHVRARHEHHLIDARESPLGDPEVSVPPEIRPLVVAIPAWLRSIARFVSGTQIRADVVEQERKANRWLKEVIVSRRVQILRDPGIVIENFVLTGWGEREIEEADRRQQQEIARAEFAMEAPKRQVLILGTAVAAIVLQVVGLAITRFGTPQSPAFLLLGLFAGLIGVAPAWYFMLSVRMHPQRPLSPHDYLVASQWAGCLAAAIIAAQLLTAAWVIGNWKLAALGVASALLTASVGIARWLAATDRGRAS